MAPKRIVILGSTGSIGRNALRVIEQFPDRFQVAGLAAGRNVELLAAQIRQHQPLAAAVLTPELAAELGALLSSGKAPEILAGSDGYCQLAAMPEADMVLSAMVGAAGLLPTLAAIHASHPVALANKETLVMAGSLVMATAADKGVAILPVDSEHSAIFQALQGNRRQDLRRIILTASGGPLLDLPPAEMAAVTPARALAHPNWAMGPKISIDSATLMNKGLEVIEARWLFQCPVDKIHVCIHPQSIIHSMVEYIDGSVIAQLGIPDMRGPIAYALSFPERLPLDVPALDLVAVGNLTFQEPDLGRFPCLRLAYEACRQEGTAPAVLNAANEEAVAAFLQERIRLPDIAALVAKALEEHQPVAAPAIEDILAADSWARSLVRNLIETN